MIPGRQREGVEGIRQQNMQTNNENKRRKETNRELLVSKIITSLHFQKKTNKNAKTLPTEILREKTHMPNFDDEKA